MLELHGLMKGVIMPDGRRLEILKGVDLNLGRGESVAILGRSGSGKSTLLNIVGLLDQPEAGSYTVNGADVSKLTDGQRSELRGSTFGFIFQNFMLFDRRTALANVFVPLYYASAEIYKRRRSLALASLGSVGLLEKSSIAPSHLSGGEQQRLAIARALVRGPACILADEPTGSLDVDTARSVLDLIFSVVRDSQRSLLIITHDPAVAALAERRLHLENGVLSAI